MLDYNKVQLLTLMVVVDLLNAWIRIDNLSEVSAMLKHIYEYIPDLPMFSVTMDRRCATFAQG